MGILIGYRRLAWSTADTQMVQVARGRFQAVGDVPNRITPGELAENHADELTPRVIALAVLVRACCPNNFSDGFFGQFADYLGKKCYLCTHKRVWVFFCTTKVVLFYLIPIPLFRFSSKIFRTTLNFAAKIQILFEL